MKTLTYAWRFLARSKTYTIINILGLSFSLACCLILMRYIHRELTVDTHCVDRNEVYAVIAYLIALPITYGLLSNWLEQFAYHVSFSILDWLLPFLVIWLVSVITVGIQAYVLMKVDPVKCLKVE